MWLSLMLSASVAHAEPCYVTDELFITWETEGRPPHGQVATTAFTHLRQEGFEELVVGEGKKRKTHKLSKKLKSKHFTPAQLSALLHVTLLPDNCEADTLVGPMGADTRDYPATLYRQGTTATAITGPRATLHDPQGPTADHLQDTYGIGALTDHGSEWEPAARGLLEQALNHLSDDELQWISGLDFRRVPMPELALAQSMGMKRGDLGAVYRQQHDGTWFEIYDASMNPGFGFVGEPDAPKPAELHTLLHEMGHAIAYANTRYTIQRTQQLIDALNASIVAENAAVEDYNNSPPTSPSQVAASEAKRAEITALQAGLIEQKQQINRLNQQIERFEAGTTPVVTAFIEALGQQSTPTRYAKTSSQEAFAECYALYKLDPVALERYNPEALAWFEAGHYLRILEEERAKTDAS